MREVGEVLGQECEGYFPSRYELTISDQRVSGSTEALCFFTLCVCLVIPNENFVFCSSSWSFPFNFHQETAKAITQLTPPPPISPHTLPFLSHCTWKCIKHWYMPLCWTILPAVRQFVSNVFTCYTSLCFYCVFVVPFSVSLLCLCCSTQCVIVVFSLFHSMCHYCVLNVV